MKSKTTLIFLCVSALCACSSSDDQSSGSNAGNYKPGGGGASAGSSGSGGASNAGNGGSGGSTAGNGGSVNGGNGGAGGSSGNAGNGGSTNTNPDSGTMTHDAGQPANDSGTVTPVGDASITPITPGQVTPSSGCGKAAPAMGDLMIDVSGTMREYIIALPATYDPMKPHKLIFAWHGLGGTAQQVASNWYGLKSHAGNDVVFVAGQGLQTSNSVGSGPGWANMNGQDVNFVKALYAQLESTVCFDKSRVFSVGMSYGGIMSDTLGCQMGDVFRAVAPMSGAGPGGHCVGQVAVWMSNGDNDMVVPTMSERTSRDIWVAANHCQMASTPVDPSPCLEYTGCDANYPVTWCEFSGGHTIPSFAPNAIWNFFSQF